MLPPVPAQLRNLRQLLSNNLGGLAGVFFVPVGHVAHVADTLSAELTTNVVLADGATWYQLVAAHQSVRYAETPAPDQHGERWKASLKGELAYDSPGLAEGLEAMRGRRFLVLFRDANGYVKLVGDVGEPLKFGYGLDTGAAVAARNERAFAFEGVLTRPARHYRGSWLVSDVGIQYEQPPTSGGGSSGGTVQVRDLAGTLLFTIPAGQTLVLDTAFSFTYSVQ